MNDLRARFDEIAEGHLSDHDKIRLMLKAAREAAASLDAKDAEIEALKKERDEARETAKRHRNKRDVAKSAARDNHRGLVTWQARATAAEAALKKAREALAEIADPLAAMQKRAEATGGRLSKLAYSIANNPHYLQEIARAYLDTEDKQ